MGVRPVIITKYKVFWSETGYHGSNIKGIFARLKKTIFFVFDILRRTYHEATKHEIASCSTLPVEKAFFWQAEGNKNKKAAKSQDPLRVSLSGTMRLTIVSHSATRHWQELGFKRDLAVLTTIKLVRHGSRTNLV